MRFRTLTEPDEMSQYPRGTGRSQEQLAAAPLPAQASLGEPAGCQPKPGGSRKQRETLEERRAEKNVDRDRRRPMGI